LCVTFAADVRAVEVQVVRQETTVKEGVSLKFRTAATQEDLNTTAFVCVHALAVIIHTSALSKRSRITVVQ
jgi:hypothetical protein